MLLVLVASKLAPSKVSCKNQIMIGALHAAAHLFVALIVMLIMEFIIETTVQSKGQFSFSVCLTLIPQLFFLLQIVWKCMVTRYSNFSI